MRQTEIRFAVCRIPGRSPEDWGTGFFVEPRGLVLTCAHVLDAAVSSNGVIEMDVFQPETYGIAPKPLRLQGRWLREHSTSATGRDLALVELISPMPDWIPTLDVLTDVVVPDKRQVFSYGFPSNRSIYGGSAAGTILGRSWEHSSRFPVLEINSGELSGGYSGAPIVDSVLNCVIGVMMSTVNADQRKKSRDLVWAIPASCLPGVTSKVHTVIHPLVQELERLAIRPLPNLLATVPAKQESLHMELLLRRIEASGEPGTPLHVSELMKQFAAASTNLLLIIGDSGSGKTVLMRQTIPALMVSGNYGPDHRKCVSLCLPASKFVSAEGGTAAEKLAHALACESVLNLPREVVRSELTTLLATTTYRFAIMLDGLDEITHRQQRFAAIELIKELGNKLHGAGHAVIVSSRPVAELERLQHGPNAALSAVLDPIVREERMRYFVKLLGQNAEDVERQFFRIGGDTMEGSPLFIAFAVSIYSRTGRLPSTPLQMYTQYVDLMFELARERPGAIAADSELLTELLELLPALAHASLAAELDDEAARRTIECVMRETCSQPVSALVRRQAAQLQLDAMLGMQLALCRDGNRLRWRHQSIRDYFAGHHIVDSHPDVTAWTKSMSAWRDDTQHGAIKFALLIRAEQSPLQRASLQAFAPFDCQSPDETVLDFLFDLIQFGALITREVREDLIDASFACGMTNPEDFRACRRLFEGSRHPFEHLIRLSHDGCDLASELISIIISNPAISVRVRKLVVDAIKNQ